MESYVKLCTITIPDFISYVKLSESRRAKYYYKGDKIPKKYSDKTKFDFKKDKYNIGILCDLKTGDKIIKNSRVAGTPKLLKIRGQDFYSGFSHHSIRIKVVEAIKESYKDHIKHMTAFKDSDYPLYVEFLYYDLRKQAQDLDNKRFAYEKCMLDLLQTEGILKNDNLDCITKLSSEFFEVVDEKDRAIEINFYTK